MRTQKQLDALCETLMQRVFPALRRERILTAPSVEDDREESLVVLEKRLWGTRFFGCVLWTLEDEVLFFETGFLQLTFGTHESRRAALATARADEIKASYQIAKKETDSPAARRRFKGQSDEAENRACELLSRADAANGRLIGLVAAHCCWTGRLHAEWDKKLVNVMRVSPSRARRAS